MPDRSRRADAREEVAPPQDQERTMKVNRRRWTLGAGPRSARAEEGAGPEPGAAPPPFPPRPRAAPRNQKLALYAGGALVVLIVVVIIVVSSRPGRKALAYVPKGQHYVQAVDVRRFLRSPLYKTLAHASHPIVERLRGREERHNFDLARDVAFVVDADDLTVLVGRFEPKRLRDGFEEGVERRERELSRVRQTPVRLAIERDEVEGREFLYCDREGEDRAFAAVGSTIACFGTRWGVRRFLKVKAGIRAPVLEDPDFAAAYAPALARGALLYRLEKADAPMVGAVLRDVLGQARVGIRAAFLAVRLEREALRLVARFAAASPTDATKLRERLLNPEAAAALARLLGVSAGKGMVVSQEGAIVVLDCGIPLEGLADIVAADKEGSARNLVLTMLAS